MMRTSFIFGDAANINCSLWFEPIIYCIRGEHARRYTTDRLYV